MGQEGRRQQKYDESGIYDIGEGIEQPLVDAQYDEGQDEGGAYPHHLHAAAGAEVEEVASLVEVVRGSADAEPSEPQE